MSEANLVSDYGWKSAAPTHSSGYVAPEILRLLKLLKVSRVLDLGAGNGALCALLSREGFDVVGVEYDKHGVAVAKAAYRDIPFYNYGVQEDPAALLESEQPFHAVVSTEVIEHLFSPHLLPIYARQVLHPGGYLMVTTPYHGYLKNLALSVAGKWDKHHTPLWHGGHIKFWSRKTLTTLLRENGFSVQAFYGVGRFPYLWKSMVLVARLA